MHAGTMSFPCARSTHTNIPCQPKEISRLSGLGECDPHVAPALRPRELLCTLFTVRVHARLSPRLQQSLPLLHRWSSFDAVATSTTTSTSGDPNGCAIKRSSTSKYTVRRDAKQVRVLLSNYIRTPRQGVSVHISCTTQCPVQRADTILY